VRCLARSLVAGCFFLGFGLGGLVIGLVLFPPLLLVRAHRVMRALVRCSYRLFVAAARLVGLFRVAISPADRARLAAARGVVVAANHLTLIDVVILMAFLPDATALAKAAAGGNLFYGALVRGAFLVKGDPVRFLEQGAALLRGGTSLVVFPEGTRRAAPPSGPEELRRGAAQLALRAGASIVPVRIACVPRVLGRGDPWWRVGAHTIVWTVTVSEPLVPPPTVASPHAAAVALTAEVYERLWPHA